jgi:hypothetical protein
MGTGVRANYRRLRFARVGTFDQSPKDDLPARLAEQQIPPLLDRLILLEQRLRRVPGQSQLPWVLPLGNAATVAGLDFDDGLADDGDSH